MLYNFFKVQQKHPVPGDWTTTVQSDLSDLDINLSEEQIQNINKENFAALVKRKLRIAAFENLMKTKATLSKMSSLNYKELKAQEYLKSRDITTTEKKQIFRYRTRMVRNFAVNFKNSATDLSCPLCHSTPCLLYTSPSPRD